MCHPPEDVPTTQQPLPRRPQLTAFTGVTTALLALCYPFNLLLCAMTALTVYENVTKRDTFPPAVRIASYLTIVAHSYTLLAPIPYLSLISALVAGFNLNVFPFIIGLVYVSLKAGLLRPLTVMDKAVIALLVSGHVSLIALVAYTRWYFNVRIYRSWLETYEPEWAPAMTDPWLRVIQRLIMMIFR